MITKNKDILSDGSFPGPTSDKINLPIRRKPHEYN
jgi:hypothetical protein